jgi:hypothetical protein
MGASGYGEFAQAMNAAAERIESGEFANPESKHDAWRYIRLRREAAGLSIGDVMAVLSRRRGAVGAARGDRGRSRAAERDGCGAARLCLTMSISAAAS